MDKKRKGFLESSKNVGRLSFFVIVTFGLAVSLQYNILSSLYINKIIVIISSVSLLVSVSIICGISFRLLLLQIKANEEAGNLGSEKANKQ